MCVYESDREWVSEKERHKDREGERERERWSSDKHAMCQVFPTRKSCHAEKGGHTKQKKWIRPKIIFLQFGHNYCFSRWKPNFDQLWPSLPAAARSTTRLSLASTVLIGSLALGFLHYRYDRWLSIRRNMWWSNFNTSASSFICNDGFFNSMIPIPWLCFSCLGG